MNKPSIFHQLWGQADESFRRLFNNTKRSYSIIVNEPLGLALEVRSIWLPKRLLRSINWNAWDYKLHFPILQIQTTRVNHWSPLRLVLYGGMLSLYLFRQILNPVEWPMPKSCKLNHTLQLERRYLWSLLEGETPYYTSISFSSSVIQSCIL